MINRKMPTHRDRREWCKNNIWRYNGQEIPKEWYQHTNSWNSATDSRNNHKQNKYKESHSQARQGKTDENRKAQRRKSQHLAKSQKLEKDQVNRKKKKEVGLPVWSTGWYTWQRILETDVRALKNKDNNLELSF